MKDFFEELRPSNGENFQVYIQPTVENQGFTKPHVHDFVEILYCIKGGYAVRADSVQGVISKGDMAIIGSRKIHTITQTSKDDGIYLVVKFQPEIIAESYKSSSEMRYLFPFIFRSSANECIFRKDIIKNAGIDKAIENIIEEITNAEYGYEIALKSEIYRIVLWFVRKFKKDEDILRGYSESTLRKIGNAIEFIEQNYKENISVKELASRAFLEYSYFSRVFKQITNMTCCDYINNLRLKKAEMLLYTTNMTVTQIGATVGFDSTSYFIKKFKAFNGISPKQFRGIK